MNPRDMGLQGVYIGWIVEEDGSVTPPMILKAETSSLAARAVYLSEAGENTERPRVVHVVSVMDGLQWRVCKELIATLQNRPNGGPEVTGGTATAPLSDTEASNG